MTKKTKKTPPETARAAGKFKWTTQKEQAAQLFAVDELTYQQIAEKLNVGARTLGDWKLCPAFVERIESHVAEYRAGIRRSGISVVENRVAHLKRRHALLNIVIAERGMSHEMQSVPGGRTGLMVHNVKSVGAGADAEKVDLYEVDAPLVKLLLEHEKQVAQELGQWTEKHDHAGEIKFSPITLDGDKEVSDE